MLNRTLLKLHGVAYRQHCE